MRCLRLLAAGLTVAVVGGCASPLGQYEIKDDTLACDPANRFAHEALTGMGFRITRLDPATPGQQGTMTGERQVRGKGTEIQRVVVKIECTGAGASVDAREKGKLLGQDDFKRGFFMSFVSVRQMAARQAEMEAKMMAGLLPPSLQRRDVRVLLEPVLGEATKLDFGFNLHAGGVLPLRMRVDNLTGRAYRLDPGDIRLTRADRARVGAISVEEAASRLAGARSAEAGQPLTTLGRKQIVEKLGANLFVARRLAPGSTVRGFLYFPAGDYVRGRIVLTEEESGETEGIVVEF